MKHVFNLPNPKTFKINTPSEMHWGSKCWIGTTVPQHTNWVRFPHKVIFFTTRSSTSTLRARNELFSKTLKAQLGVAPEVTCGIKVLASHVGLLLTWNIMLTDAKSLPAVVNEGIFLSGAITAGDPFYMKWSNFIHHTHASYNYSRLVDLTKKNVFIQTIIDFHQCCFWQRLQIYWELIRLKLN